MPCYIVFLFLLFFIHAHSFPFPFLTGSELGSHTTQNLYHILFHPYLHSSSHEPVPSLSTHRSDLESLLSVLSQHSIESSFVFDAFDITHWRKRYLEEEKSSDESIPYVFDLPSLVASEGHFVALGLDTSRLQLKKEATGSGGKTKISSLLNEAERILGDSLGFDTFLFREIPGSKVSYKLAKLLEKHGYVVLRGETDRDTEIQEIVDRCVDMDVADEEVFDPFLLPYESSGPVHFVTDLIDSRNRRTFSMIQDETEQVTETELIALARSNCVFRGLESLFSSLIASSTQVEPIHTVTGGFLSFPLARCLLDSFDDILTLLDSVPMSSLPLPAFFEEDVRVYLQSKYLCREGEKESFLPGKDVVDSGVDEIKEKNDALVLVCDELNEMKFDELILASRRSLWRNKKKKEKKATIVEKEPLIKSRGEEERTLISDRQERTDLRYHDTNVEEEKVQFVERTRRQESYNDENSNFEKIGTSQVFEEEEEEEEWEEEKERESLTRLSPSSGSVSSELTDEIRNHIREIIRSEHNDEDRPRVENTPQSFSNDKNDNPDVESIVHEALQQHTTDLSSDLEDFREEISQLRSIVDESSDVSLDTELATLGSDVGKIKLDVSKIYHDAKASKDQVGELKKRQDGLETSLRMLSSQVEELKLLIVEGESDNRRESNRVGKSDSFLFYAVGTLVVVGIALTAAFFYRRKRASSRANAGGLIGDAKGFGSADL